MLTRKQRSLLKVITHEGSIEKIRLVKLMFIISNDDYLKLHFPFYSFIPYHFGPFSFELYKDLSALELSGHIALNEETITPTKGDMKNLDTRISLLIERYLRDYRNLSDSELIRHIYSRHPYYTIFSKIEKKSSYKRDETGVATIGYQGRSIDNFLDVLIKNKVQLLIDVRRNAFSRKYGYSKKQLQNILSKFDIDYHHMPELGISSQTRKGLLTRQDYIKAFKQYSIQISTRPELIDKLVAFSEEKKIALMCYEEDPTLCHRGVISNIMHRKGIEVKEI
jgi:uncharacterized protein (DUF488 family)